MEAEVCVGEDMNRLFGGGERGNLDVVVAGVEMDACVREQCYRWVGDRTVWEEGRHTVVLEYVRTLSCRNRVGLECPWRLQKA